MSFFWIMHQSFVTTAPSPTGKGGDYDFSASVSCYKPQPRELTGGQNLALCPALRNGKFPLGKDSNVKNILFPWHWGGGGGGSGYKQMIDA